MVAQSNKPSLKTILEKYNIHPNKIMGQNFLIDENVLNKIIETANLKPNDIVLEIGPGLGILTLELAKKAKRIIAIEKDKELCVILREMLDAGGVRNVEIVNADILKISNFKIDSKFKTSPTGRQVQNYKLVANIPYYLTSPLIRMFLEADHKPSEIILMVQKEVAERICAMPPKMSLLAVSVQFYAKPEIISFVSKNSFYPAPKVDSAIIKIVPHDVGHDVGHAMSHINTEKFFKLVKIGFSAKRKMLINNLSHKFKIKNSKLKILFEQIEFNQKCRAENLTIDNWIKLYTFLNYLDI